MKILRFAFVSCAILSLLFVVLYFFCGRQIGRLEAEYDLWRGRYEIHGYGLVFGVPLKIAALKSYGVEYRQVAGCVVNDFIIESVAAYNATMKKAIKRDLDIDIDWPAFSKVKMEAIADLQEKNSEEQQKRSVGSTPHVYTITLDMTEDSSNDIGDCFLNAVVELDGDPAREDVCLRYLTSESKGNNPPGISLVVDLSKGKNAILRQIIDRGVFFDEGFVSFKDMDNDGRAEMITRVRFSPDCSGCGAKRIYELKDYHFTLQATLFGININHPSLKKILRDLPDNDKKIISCLKEKTKDDQPCGVYGECTISAPWILDTNQNGQLEIVMLVEPPRGDFGSSAKNSYLFFSEYSADGENLQRKLISLPLEHYPIKKLLGFIETRDKRIHLLINIAGMGTTSAFPILNVFDIRWPKLKKIGEFFGFYEHVISDRLRDLDGDGNTEIISVGESYVPPGAAYADIVLLYDVAEYRDGKYIKNNTKFESRGGSQKMSKQVNGKSVPNDIQ